MVLWYAACSLYADDFNEHPAAAASIVTRLRDGRQVREQRQMSKRQGNDRWVRDSDTVRHGRMEAPWGLADGTAMLPVVDALRAHLTMPLFGAALAPCCHDCARR